MPAVADQAPVPAKPDPINWIVGPAQSDLGEYASINVPEGYRFAPADQAQILFKLNNQPAPEGLAGILAPVSGRLTIVFEYSETGYLKDEGTQRLDAAAILTTLREKIQRLTEQSLRPGAAAIITSDWESEPEYNPAGHTLEWAFRAGQSVNHVFCLFGRNGVLRATAVQPRQALIEPLPLQRLMSGVSFKTGYAYADFHSGDKVATYTLAGLITSDNSPAATSPRSTISNGLILALVGGVSLVCIVAAAWIVVRARRNRKMLEIEKRPAAPAAVPAPAHANGSAKPLLKAEMPLPQNHVNGKQNGHSKLRRRRMFNYQKYYSDLLMQVSDRAYESNLDRPDRNGVGSRQKDSQNGASGNGASESPEGKSTNLTANLGLIESQRNLIEEQQRLIREQTKLIEEKTRLIHEKNQVLDKQSELFGNNSF